MPRLEAKNPDIAKKREWLKGRPKYITGYCNNVNKPAQHEGTKPKNHLGHPLPTCPKWETCPCECHYNVDQLFEMTGQDRQEIPNPEYIPDHGHFVMPVYADPVAADVASTGDGVTTPPNDEHTLGAPASPAAAPLASRRTPTGRAARGGLEAQVWEACRSIDTEPKTPKVIADWIAEKYTIPTPSSGAVNAVWDRWVKLGFCEQAKKPNRFLKFIGEGSWDELQRKKNSIRTTEKAAKSAARRGFR
jgi:hypothetical protein